jgi:hypothetical protein
MLHSQNMRICPEKDQQILCSWFTLLVFCSYNHAQMAYTTDMYDCTKNTFSSCNVTGFPWANADFQHSFFLIYFILCNVENFIKNLKKLNW